MRAFVLAVTLVAPLLLAGCGGGNDEPARSAYATRLEALCDETRAAIERLGEPKTPAELVKVMPRTNQIGRTFVRKLERIVPSAAEAPKAKQLYELYDSYYGSLIAALPPLRRNDLNSYYRIVESGLEARVRADSLAKELGAPDCARQPFTSGS